MMSLFGKSESGDWRERVSTNILLADSLTKSQADPSRLIKVLETGKME